MSTRGASEGEVRLADIHVQVGGRHLEESTPSVRVKSREPREGSGDKRRLSAPSEASRSKLFDYIRYLSAHL